MNRQIKRMLALLLALLIAAISVAVAEEAVEAEAVVEAEAEAAPAEGADVAEDEPQQEPTGDTQGLRRIRLGSSVYTVKIDDDFVAGEMSDEDIAAGQIACFQNDETGLDMDVFQYSKEGKNPDLAHYTLERANAEEKVEVVWPTDVVNDISMGLYWSTKTRNDEAQEAATVILDSGDTYLDLVFWPRSDRGSMEVVDIIYSIAYMSLKQIHLGTSNFTLVVPDDYMMGEISDEDVADDQVAYWYSDESTMDFDVYQFSKEGEPDALAEYAQKESSTYPVVTELVTDEKINLVPVAWYRTVEECDEGEYDTITYIIDGGDEYLEVVFWLDGPTANAEADFIIHNLIDESLAEAEEQAED